MYLPQANRWRVLCPTVVLGLVAGCTDPTPPAGPITPTTPAVTPPAKTVARSETDALLDMINRHPVLQRSRWVRADGVERPDGDIPAAPPLATQDVAEELSLNGAMLVEHRLGQVTVANFLHSKPRQPKKLVDAGLALLRHLPQLRVVGLYNAAVTDAGLRHLAALGELTEVELAWTGVGDDGVRHLKGLTRLQVLGLHNTQVTDAGVEHLRGMKHLRLLTLGGTGVTDAAVETLAGLTELSGLRVGDTKITQQGVDRLARALPRCKISR